MEFKKKKFKLFSENYEEYVFYFLNNDFIKFLN